MQHATLRWSTHLVAAFREQERERAKEEVCVKEREWGREIMRGRGRENGLMTDRLGMKCVILL